MRQWMVVLLLVLTVCAIGGTALAGPGGVRWDSVTAFGPGGVQW